MSRSGEIKCLIEPELEALYKELCSKKEISASTGVRAMIIDELRLHGLLPEESSVSLLKKMPEYTS